MSKRATAPAPKKDQSTNTWWFVFDSVHLNANGKRRQIVRRGFQSAYLGYAVGKPFAGQGYMRDGLELVLRHAFTTLRLHRIEANIQPANASSLALAKGAGFRREGFSPRYLKIGGRWRDHERWAILAEEWRARAGTAADSNGAPESA